jgi:hypothetical protein
MNFYNWQHKQILKKKNRIVIPERPRKNSHYRHNLLVLLGRTSTMKRDLAVPTSYHDQQLFQNMQELAQPTQIS